ncbi:MAG: methylmalonyl-CoA epimerase [Euryarchaeota archaeon]|nr:methylmalonyl-CoA epimerase [Euryarchaeota archaeon]
MKIKKIDHVALATRSIEDATKIWKEMGMDIHYEEVPEQKVKVAMIKIGDSRLEILEPTAEDSPISRFLEKHGGGLHHIAVEVDDIENAIDELKSKGFRMIDETPRVGAGGKKIAFVHPKSAKVLLELVEAKI